MFGCDCGQAEEGADHSKSNVSTPYRPLVKNTKSRIVGGYAPKTRPWMALLELHPKVGRKITQCGGAIINRVSMYMK